jgi:hypothetical protein
MDKEDYISNLKNTDLRPSRVKLKEKHEEVLLEDKDSKHSIKVLQEIFIQVAEIEKMKSGLAKDLAMLRLATTAELDAVNLYMRFADLAADEDISKVMVDVAKEEKTHAGEFEALMRKLDPNYAAEEEKGEDEVKKLTGI